MRILIVVTVNHTVIHTVPRLLQTFQYLHYLGLFVYFCPLHLFAILIFFVSFCFLLFVFFCLLFVMPTTFTSHYVLLY